MNNLKKYFKNVDDNVLALGTLVLIAALMIAIAIILAGTILAATYLWHWPGFAFAAGAIATVLITCYIGASNE
jgi:hypothetical protein